MGEQYINMRGLLYIIGLFLLPSLSDACLCNGITAATCDTAPCTIQCGLCRDKCCQLPFGREEESEENRWILPCLSGRKEQESLRELDPGCLLKLQINATRAANFKSNFLDANS